MFNSLFTTSDLLYLLQGAWVTLQLTFWAMLIGTSTGMLLGWIRVCFPRMSLPLAWLLDVSRSVPLLIQFVLINSAKSLSGLSWSSYTVGCVVLGMYCAAYCTEIVRSGLLAVPYNLSRAARSLGLSYWQELRSITMPMAMRISFPSWLSLTLGAMKDTALVLWLGIVELLRASQTVITRIQEPLLVLCIVGLIYYIMSWGLAWLGSRVEKRWQHSD